MSHLVNSDRSYSFSKDLRFPCLDAGAPESFSMGFQYFAGAVFRALTATKDGPSLYDVCDPLLQNYGGGDPHLGQFYRTALGNPALRPLLRRTGLPALKDPARLERLRE